MTFFLATDPTDALRHRLSEGPTAALTRPLFDSAVRLPRETAGIESAGVSRFLASSA